MSGIPQALGEPEARAWVLDMMDLLGPETFAFVMETVYGASIALLLQEPTLEVQELADSIRDYLQRNGRELPF